MELELIKAAASIGAPSLALIVVLIYLGRNYLPAVLAENRRTMDAVLTENRSTVDSILKSHSRDFADVTESLEGMQQQLRTHSKISLIQTLIDKGMSPAEAELEAKRIIANGGNNR